MNTVMLTYESIYMSIGAYCKLSNICQRMTILFVNEKKSVTILAMRFYSKKIVRS